MDRNTVGLYLAIIIARPAKKLVDDFVFLTEYRPSLWKQLFGDDEIDYPDRLGRFLDALMAAEFDPESCQVAEIKQLNNGDARKIWDTLRLASLLYGIGFEVGDRVMTPYVASLPEEDRVLAQTVIEIYKGLNEKSRNDNLTWLWERFTSSEIEFQPLFDEASVSA